MDLNLDFLFSFTFFIIFTVIDSILVVVEGSKKLATIGIANDFELTNGRRNFTREECLSIERTNSVRHSSKVVIVAETNPAYLHCTVPHATDNLVAWTRLADDALLTAGGQSFTTDVRFQVSPKRHARDWVLIIRRVQISDSGCYLCEVNTEPVSTLFPVYLNVLPAQEVISKSAVPHKQSAQLMVKMEGKALHLNCTVEISDRQLMPDTIIWTRDSNQLDLNNNLKYYTSSQVSDKYITYTLQIRDVSNNDDGLYACEGDAIPRAAQMVHFNSNNTSLPSFVPRYLLLIIFILYLSQ